MTIKDMTRRTHRAMAIKDMPKTMVTNIFKALDDMIANADDLDLDRQVLEEIRIKIEEAMVMACVESDPDTFALFEDGGQLKVNLVETVKAWGFVRRADGRWADEPTAKVLSFINGDKPPDQPA